MELTRLQLERQIERYRRLADMMTDEDVRQAIEQLISEYEARLPEDSRGKGFMLRH